MKPALMALLALCLCLPLAGADKAKPLPKDIPSLKALAEKGDARAQNNLGIMYYNARYNPASDPVLEMSDIRPDFKEAVKWYRKAAEQGMAKAQYNLELMYEKSNADNKEVVKWFREAAEQGMAEAQFSLALQYVRSGGWELDNVIAYAWFNIVAANGHGGASTLEELIAKFEPEQIAKVQELSREMLKKNPKLLKK